MTKNGGNGSKMAKNGGNTEGFSISSVYGGILRKTEAVATLVAVRAPGDKFRNRSAGAAPVALAYPEGPTVLTGTTETEVFFGNIYYR